MSPELYVVSDVHIASHSRLPVFDAINLFDEVCQQTVSLLISKQSSVYYAQCF